MPSRIHIGTSGFSCLRRHGAGVQLYSGCCSPEQPSRDAELIRGLREQGKQVYTYFNNDAHGWAVQNAIQLKQMLRE